MTLEHPFRLTRSTFWEPMVTSSELTMCLKNCLDVLRKSCRNHLQVHPSDDHAATLNQIEAGDRHPIRVLENRFECKDGSYRWLDWSIQPVLEEGLLYGVGRDIMSENR